MRYRNGGAATAQLAEQLSVSVTIWLGFNFSISVRPSLVARGLSLAFGSLWSVSDASATPFCSFTPHAAVALFSLARLLFVSTLLDLWF